MSDDLIKQVVALQRQVDGLVKPEVPLGMSLIVETVLAASATGITFSSIPQGFRHLMIVAQVRTDAVAETDGLFLRLNGDTGGNYDWERLTANSATLTGLATRAATSIQFGLSEGASSLATNFSPTFGYIFGYTNTANSKWTISANAVFGDVSADADLFLQLRAGRWRSAAAVTSVILGPSTGPNFVSGSRFQLYGIM